MIRADGRASATRSTALREPVAATRPAPPPAAAPSLAACAARRLARADPAPRRRAWSARPASARPRRSPSSPPTPRWSSAAASPHHASTTTASAATSRSAPSPTSSACRSTWCQRADAALARHNRPPARRRAHLHRHRRPLPARPQGDVGARARPRQARPTSRSTWCVAAGTSGRHIDAIVAPLPARARRRRACCSPSSTRPTTSAELVRAPARSSLPVTWRHHRPARARGHRGASTDAPDRAWPRAPRQPRRGGRSVTIDQASGLRDCRGD